MASTNNTAEYRATLDASGVKAGAAEANQALSGIGGDGLKTANTGLNSAAQGAQGLEKAAKGAADSVTTVGPAGAKAGTEAADGLEKAAKSAAKFGEQAKGAKQAVDGISTESGRQQLDAYGQTAAQTAQAMRYLPMQITDVVTSVASGMPVYMVAIQQGGQLKDSFGGIGNAAKATTGYLLGAVNPLAILGAGAAAVGLAYYQGSKEMDTYNRSVVLSGNAAGVTALQLNEMARQVDAVTGTQSAAAPILAEMARSGKIAGDSLAEFTAMALRMESVGGNAISTTVKELEELGKKPTEASAKLQEQYSYLTPAVYRQIKALEDLDKTEEAAALAQKTYASAMSDRVKQLENELGYLERGWRSVKSSAAEAWDAMLNVGRPTTVMDKAQSQITALEAELTRRKEQNERLGIKDGKATRDLELQIENAKGLQQTIASVDKATGDALERTNKARQTGIDLINESTKYLTKQEQKTQALAAAQQKYVGYIKELRDSGQDKEADKAQTSLDKVVAGINERFKGSGGARGGIKVTDNELANMQGQLQAAKAYYEQLVTLGAGATGLNTAERESLIIGEQIKRTTDEKVIAKLREKQTMADALGVQLRTNEGLEQSFAAHAKLIESTNSQADAITNQAQRQEAANEVFGRGKTAIEQMTLAELQKQMAEAQASDSFDPKYIAALELKINAQKRFVDALGQADYKAVAQHTDELLRNAQSLQAVYKDELSLSGKTGIEREKIAALRQVELKYAKELAKIDNSTISETQKQTERIKVLEAQGIESAMAVAKVTDKYWEETTGNINRGLTDALMQGFDNGWKDAKSFGKSLLSMFNNMVLRPVISFIVQPISMMINGVLQGVMGSMGGGGGFDLASLLSNGSSAYNLYTGNGLIGQGAQYAANLFGWGAGAGGAYSLGGTAAATSSYGLGMGGGYGLGAGSYGLAAPSGGYFAGTTAAGSAGGSAGAGSMAGVGWAAAVVIAAAYLGGMFKDEKQVGAGITGELGGDMYGYQLMRESGGLFDGPNYRYLIAEKEIKDIKAEIEAVKADDKYTQLGARGEAARDEKLQRLYKQLEVLERDYGGAIDGSKGPIKILQEAFEGIREKVATQAESLGLDGEAVRQMKVSLGLDEIHPDTGGKGLDLTGLSQQEAAAKIDKALKDANEELARSLLGSYQEVTKEITTTVWENVRVDDGGETERWERVGHQVTETVTEMEWVMSEYVREGETAVQALDRMATGITIVNQMFDLLGAKTMDASLANGDWASKVVEAAGGLDKFNQAVNTYFDLYYSDSEKRAHIASTVDKGMEEKGLDLRSGDSNAKAKYRALVDKAMDEKDDELLAWLLDFANDFAAGVDAANASLKAASDAMQEQLEELARAAQEAVDKAWEALQRSIASERTAAMERMNLAQETVTSTSGLVSLLRDQVRDLRSEVLASAQMSVQAGRVFIDNALSAVKNTGYLPDRAELSQAINAARSGMGAENYASRIDFERDRLTMAAKLQVLGDNAQDQLSTAEQSLQAEKDTVARLDDLLKSQKQAIDIWKGIDTSVISVAQAVDGLSNVMMGKNPDGTPKDNDSPSTGAGGGGSGGAMLGGSGGEPRPGDAVVGYTKDGRVKYADGSVSNPISESASAKLAAGNSPYTQLDYGTGQSTTDKVEWNEEKQLYVPKFESGINRVPYDMFAYLHEDETVVPAKFNPFNPRAATPWLPASGSSGDEVSRALLAQILRAVQRQSSDTQDIRQNTKDTADMLLRSVRGGNSLQNNNSGVLEL